MTGMFENRTRSHRGPGREYLANRKLGKTRSAEPRAVRGLTPETAAEIKRHCAYITDDSTISCYHKVPRETVAWLRKQLPPPPRINQYTLGQWTSCTGMNEPLQRETAFKDGSWRLLRALLTYGTKHGLPNIAPEACEFRLSRLRRP